MFQWWLETVLLSTPRDAQSSSLCQQVAELLIKIIVCCSLLLLTDLPAVRHFLEHFRPNPFPYWLFDTLNTTIWSPLAPAASCGRVGTVALFITETETVSMGKSTRGRERPQRRKASHVVDLFLPLRRCPCCSKVYRSIMSATLVCCILILV